jgi:lipopolysaccharide export system protein LptC
MIMFWSGELAGVTHDDTMTVDGAAGQPGTRHIGPAARRVKVDWRYTKFVGLMRLLLPASAMILAATVIVWPSFNVTDSNNVVDFEAIPGLLHDDRPTMSNARFLGTDKDGNPFTVTAEIAWQEQGYEDLIYMEVLQGDMMMEDGMWATIWSDRGVYDQVGQLLIVESNVNVFTDEGYELHSDYALIDLDQAIAEGHMPVRGQGPAGLIDAQGFRITDNGDRLFFDGRVHLTIYPGVEE